MPERYEHILFRYSSALERGDFETVADVLREAERDPALEAMLLELNDVYAAEQTGRSNHRNPKELTMIAPLYEKRTPERVRTYNLPMVAALAVVALLGVLLATRIAPPTQWNTAQNGSPEPNVVQVDPTECTEGVPVTIKLYSRPSADAFVTYEVNSALYFPQSALRQLDAAEADGETWYFVSVDQGVSSVQGWMTAEEYNRNVRCAALVNADILTQGPDLTSTATPIDVGLLMSATAVVVQASEMPPTMVPPDVLAVVTATPVPFVHPNILPTVVPAEAQTANELLICTNEAQVSLEVHTEPSSESPVIVTLHAGAIFQSFQRVTQADGVRWTQVQEQVQGVTIGGGWVVMEVPDYRRIECFVSVQITGTPMSNTGDALFLPTLVPADVRGLATFTATPAPFDGSMPTVVPTSTPLPLNGDAPPTISMPEPLAIVPTLVPFVPTTVPGENLSIPAYPLYAVQEGDTLLSILSQFKLSAAWLDQLIFINDLPDETSELPDTLLIPVPSGRQLLTCVVDDGEAVDLRIDPASDASSILALPAGAVFQVIDEVETADGTWYMAAWQAGGAPLRSGWVNVEAISRRSDCRRFSASFETSYSLSTFDPATYPYGIEACFVVTANAITAYFPPTPDADIVNEIPAGTQLQVIALELNDAGLWYSVLYYRHVNPVGSQYMSYVPVEVLELPDSCNADEVIAAAKAEATSPAPTVIPARGNFYGGFTNCVAITNRPTLVTLGSTRDSEVLTELPAGMQLEVTGGTEQSDGMWYLLNYVTEYGTIMSGFVSGEDVTVAGDCPLISVPLELTATPMPTALPPSATPTPAR
jgi:hypothetical protein